MALIDTTEIDAAMLDANLGGNRWMRWLPLS